MPESRRQVTRILARIESDGGKGVEALMPLVYNELQRLANHHLSSERNDHTLSATALVHEAYLRLVDQREVEWRNRKHFFAIASMAMRRVLVNYARDRSRKKRGGARTVLSLDNGLDVASPEQACEIVALDRALERLAEVNERAAKVVECRFFGGLTIEEAAETLEIAPITVKRDWMLAKTWLRRELSDPGKPPDRPHNQQ